MFADLFLQSAQISKICVISVQKKLPGFFQNTIKPTRIAVILSTQPNPRMHRRIFTLALILLFSLKISSAQTGTIILGRPTDSTITASVMFPSATWFYLEAGTSPGVYTHTTAIVAAQAKVPEEVDLTGLLPDTRYYYRMQSGTLQSGPFTPTPEYTFHTQRAPGQSFTFTIEADEHLYDKKGVDNMYKVTLQNEANDHPDFMLSLGDIFGDDHTPDSTTLADMDSLHANYRPFLGEICHSVPFYVCLGNHEGEKRFHLLNNPPNNIAVYGTLTRKKYYPNPYPNNFYTGDTTAEGFGMGQPENYYAWTWGDALLVVMDVYRYDSDTTAKPIKWEWTIGQQQYDWLKNTLQTSTAKYKFVFAHHVRGEGRGGLTNATLYEWGGYDGANGTNWGWPTNRPGWAMPIHDLFVTYGVNIFFQGHDHLFAHEVLNNVVYQETPMAADSTYEIGMLANASAYTADTLDGTGHLRVSVNPNCVTVDFIRAYLPADTLSGLHHNSENAFSYSVGACATGISENTETPNVFVYPNPATDYLTVRTDKPMLANLYDVTGRPVLSASNSFIDLHAIPSGIYLLQLQIEQQLITRKLAINR